MKTKVGLLMLSMIAAGVVDANVSQNQSSQSPKSSAQQSCIISPVQATSEVEVDFLNLNAWANVPTNPVFSPSDTTSFNSITSATIYDALGVTHLLDFYFIKSTTPNVWSAAIVIDGKTITLGQLVFDTSGALVKTTGLDVVVWTPNNLAPETLNINLNCPTQYNGQANSGIVLVNGYSGKPSFHSQVASLHRVLAGTCHSVFSDPVPTTEVKVNDNLSAADNVPAHKMIQPQDPSSYNFKDTVTVYDSLGAPYNLSIYYAKDVKNRKWNVGVYLYATQLGSGQIKFDSHGVISRTSGLDHLSWLPYSGAVSPQNFKIDMTCSTQYGFADEDVETPWQDGKPGQQMAKKKLA